MKRRVAMFIAVGVVVPAVMALKMSSAEAVVPPGDPVAASPRIVAGLDEPLVPSSSTSPDEDSALDAAIAAFRVAALFAPTDPAFHLAPLVAFARTHPDCGWTAAVLTNLGLADQRAGLFSGGLAAFQAAWKAGRTGSDARAKPLVDRAAGELASMHARLGRTDELDRLLHDIGTRALGGPATETLAAAREDAWIVHDDPGQALRCGPTALGNLLLARGVASDRVAFLDGQRASRQVFSLAQLSALASRAQLRHWLIVRAPGQAVPVPSVVHWSLRYFAAIVAERDGGYLIKDPTLGSGTDELWVGRDAIDSEASGLFLVPA